MSSRRDLVVALIAIAACKDPPKPPADASAPPMRVMPPVAVAPTPPAPQTSVVALDEPKQVLPRQESFTLLDPGKGARAPLRYALAAGTTSFHAETTLSSRQLANGAFTPPVALPAIRDGLAVTTDQPGTLALRGLPVEAATVSPEAEAYMARWRTLIENRRATVAIDPRGQLGAIAFNDDATGARSAPARDALAERLLTAIVPLPAEPVAVGASWRVTTILRQGPAYAKQTATYQLTARTPARWKLHVKLQRIAKEQRIDDPTLPAGTTADLQAMFRQLEGDVEIDPRYPLVTTGTATVESRIHVKLQPPGAGTPAVEQLIEDTGSLVLSHRP